MATLGIEGAIVHNNANWAPKGCSYEPHTNEFYVDGTGGENSCGTQFHCICLSQSCKILYTFDLNACEKLELL